MRIYRNISMLAAAVTMLCACEYKDLEDVSDYTREVYPFTISFDWQKTDSIPDEMRVAFYPVDDYTGSRGYTFFDVLNRDTTVHLPAGIYDVTAWNRDTRHVLTDGYSTQNSLYATTGSYSPHGNYIMPKVLDSLYNGQRVLDYPDYMAHAHQQGFEVVNNGDNQKITLTPDSMVVTVEVKLHGIKGLEYCKNIRAAINNVAGTRFISFDNLTQDEVAIMFDAQGHPEDSLVTAKFWIFGIEPSDVERLDHRLITFFWLQSGQVFIPLDVTNAVAQYRKDDTYILIESPDLGIDLKDYLNSDSGIIVDVNEWENINVDVSF